MSAPTQHTTSPRPKRSLLRRRQRRATANLLVRGVGPGGGRPATIPGRDLPRNDARETTRRFLTMGGQLLPWARGHSCHRTADNLPAFPAALPSLSRPIRLPRRRAHSTIPRPLRTARMNEVAAFGLLCFVSLFAVVEPLGLLPIFIGMTGSMAPAAQRSVARRAC